MRLTSQPWGVRLWATLAIGLFALALLTTPGYAAVYEDQVGTRDWHHTLIGTPTHTTIARQSSTAPWRLVVATNRNVVAVLNPHSSPRLIWRQKLDATDPILDLAVHDSAVLTLSGSTALTVRAWDLESAFLLWEHHFPATNPPTLGAAFAQLRAVTTVTGSSVAAVLCPEWLALLDTETGAEIWQKRFTTVPYRLWALDNTFYLVGTHHTGVKKAQTQIDRVDLTTGDTTNVFAVGRPPQDMAVVTSSAHGPWVVFKTPKNHLAAQTLASADSQPLALDHQLLTPAVLSEAKLVSQDSSSFVMTTGVNRAWLVVVAWADSVMAVEAVLPIHVSAQTLPAFSTVQKQSGSPFELVAALVSPTEMQVRDLASPSTFVSLGLPKHLASQGPIVYAQLVPANDLAATTALIVLQSGNVALLNSSAVIWSRAEALTDTVDMQWLDILGSIEWSQESDELAEEPAVTQQRSSVALYLRRWRLHLQRLGHTLTTLGWESLWSPALAFSPAPNDPFDPATMALHELRHTSAPEKLAVFLSSTGMVTALNAAHGHIMWATFLPQSAASPTVDGVTFTHLFVIRSAMVRPPPLLAAVGQTASGSTVVYHINALTGEVVPMTAESSTPLVLPFAAHQAYQMPFEDPLSRSQVLAVLAKDSLQLTLVPNTAETRTALASQASMLSLVISTADQASSNTTTMPFAMAGFHPVLLADSQDTASARLVQNWALQFPEPERLVQVTPRRGYERVASLGRVLGDRSVLYKFLNPHSLAVITANEAVDSTTPGTMTLGFYLIDAVSGAILYHAEHRHARYDPTVHPVHVVQCENWVVYQYWWEDTGASIDPANHKAHDHSGGKGYVTVVLDQFESAHPDTRLDATVFSSRDGHQPYIASKSFLLTEKITALGVTTTQNGVAVRELVLGLASGRVTTLPRLLLDPRRPVKEPTDEQKQEGLAKYDVVLPNNPKWTLSYYQAVWNVQHITSAPAQFESTSLVLAYGLDVFFTQVNPSGTFDQLSQSFSKPMLVMTIVGLVTGVVVSSTMLRRKRLRDAWI